MATDLLQRPTGQGTVGLATFGTGSYHWDRVNEEAADDTDGVESSGTSVVKDRLTFPALGITGTINSVRLYGRFYSLGLPAKTQAPYARVGFYIGSTEYYSATWVPATSFTEYYKEWTVSPATSAAFTVAEIDAASYLISLLSGDYDDGKGGTIWENSECSQFWRVVNYTETAGGFIQQIMKHKYIPPFIGGR